MEQTTNHKAAPLPGVFLGEESILYTTGKNIRCESITGVFFFSLMIIFNNSYQIIKTPMFIEYFSPLFQMKNDPADPVY